MSTKLPKLDTLEDLHNLVQRFQAAEKDNDVETQQEIMKLLIRNEQEAYQRKLRLLAELKTLKQEARASEDETRRVKRLIALFKFCAELRRIGHDELADRETGDKATGAALKASEALKSIGPTGTSALAELLDDASVSVRCSAAIHLLRLFPDKAVPVLMKIEKEAIGTSVAVSAGFALSYHKWDLEREAKPTPSPSS